MSDVPPLERDVGAVAIADGGAGSAASNGNGNGHHRAAATRFTESGFAYLLRHAIDPELAASLGVREDRGALVYPYDGFERRRPLNRDRTFQPSGVPLCLWWPTGDPAPGAEVLLCEGEPDALAALTSLVALNGAAPIEPPVVGAIPGTGTPTEAVVDELRGASAVTLVMDGDPPGRRCQARLAEALRRADITVRTIDLQDGKDLADLLAASDDPGRTLTGLLADAQAAADEAAPVDAGSSPIRFLSPDELRASVPPEPPWRWHGFLAGGALTVLSGKPKAGKSTLALALAHAAAAQAANFLGHAIKGGPVIYVSEEGAATLGHKLGHGDLRIATRESAWPRPDWRPLVEAAQAEATRVGACLLVVDTFAFWAGLPPEAEKDAGAMQAAMEPLIAATRGGLAVLLVVHSRKGGGDDGEAVRGSSALAGAADVVLELERVGSDSPRQRKLLALSRYPQTPGALVIDHDPRAGAWSVIGEGTDRGDARDIASRGALLAALEYDADLTRTDLETATGKASRDWHKTLEQLIDDGMVTRSGEGKKGDPYRYKKLREGAAQNLRTNGGAAVSDAAAPRRGAASESNAKGFRDGAQPTETEPGRDAAAELERVAAKFPELTGDGE